MESRSTPVHRPVRSSAVNSTQSILQGPLAHSNRAGIFVFSLPMIISGLTRST